MSASAPAPGDACSPCDPDSADFHADDSAWSTACGVSLPASLRVLVAEDCPINQALACAMLSLWGITPVVASNGEEAVHLAAGHRFDFILMDIEMPVMDGLMATLAIRRQERGRAGWPRVPVVAYTAGDLARRPLMMRRWGIDAVLQKPCDAAAVAQCLLRWCIPQAPVVSA